MSDELRAKTNPAPRRGVLVEAQNGPAIEYDESGIVLHLSDLVVADLARRLPQAEPGGFFAPADPALAPGAPRHAVRSGDALPEQAPPNQSNPAAAAGPALGTARSQELHLSAPSDGNGKGQGAAWALTHSLDAEALSPSLAPEALPHRLDPALLGDIDAWDLGFDGRFYRFWARLPGVIDQPRRYLCEGEIFEVQPGAPALTGGSAARADQAVASGLAASDQVPLSSQGAIQPQTERPRTAGHSLAFSRPPAAVGAIMAETSGPVQVILGLGGGRFCTTWPEAPDFPQHVVSVSLPDPGETPVLASALRTRLGESMLADAILHPLYTARRALPLVSVVQELAPPGYDPRSSVPALLAGFDRSRILAEALGRRARVRALRLDLGCDQAPQSATEFYDMAIALLGALSSGLAKRDAGSFPYLLCPDAGAWWQDPGQPLRAALEGLHQLQLRPAGHSLIIPAPGYSFAQDALGQPLEQAMLLRAELEALALETVEAGGEWLCPLLCLAERAGQMIRATFRASGPLQLDPADPFGAGPAAGFALRGTTARISEVRIAPGDPQALLLACEGALEPDGSGAPLSLDLGFGDERQAQTDPAAQQYTAPGSTALRDSFSVLGRSGQMLHRWALPASVTVH